ncbi:MAG: hypothetical protein K6B46_06645 [Opitutales bacterium]|nr:hypothetical protein [Opitutales bacterium]
MLSADKVSYIRKMRELMREVFEYDAENQTEPLYLQHDFELVHGETRYHYNCLAWFLRDMQYLRMEFADEKNFAEDNFIVSEGGREIFRFSSWELEHPETILGFWTDFFFSRYHLDLTIGVATYYADSLIMYELRFKDWPICKKYSKKRTPTFETMLRGYFWLFLNDKAAERAGFFNGIIMLDPDPYVWEKDMFKKTFARHKRICRRLGIDPVDLEGKK